MEKSSQSENIFMKIVKYLIPWKGDKPTEVIRKIIFVSALTVLITTVVIFFSSKSEAEHEQSIINEITDLYHGGGVTIDTEEKDKLQQKYPEVQEKFLPLLNDGKIRTDDLVGWITINSAGGKAPIVDDIVMQSDDNDFYLSHNSRGDYYRSGSIFADYRCKFEADNISANTVLYGHNMIAAIVPAPDYFGVLIEYLNNEHNKYYPRYRDNPNDISFYKEHPTVTFSTLYDTNEYKIFGGVMTNTTTVAGEVFKYHNVHNFANKAAFDNFCAEILDRSCFINPDVDLQYGDELLTLSTCVFGYGKAADSRFVIFARKTREGESPEVDVEKAYSNPSPKFYDLYYSIFGGSWESGQWPEEIIWGYKRKES